jgi:hypothetical protein
MDRPVYWLDHQAFCRRHGFDFHEDLIPQFKEAFEHFGQDYDQIRGSDAPIVMFIMSYHFQRENVIVMINKYFYQEFFMDPDVQDPHREEKVSIMHETSMRFIAQYLNLGSTIGNVQSAEFDELVQECFPGLRPFLMEQTGPPAFNSKCPFYVRNILNYCLPYTI